MQLEARSKQGMSRAKKACPMPLKKDWILPTSIFFYYIHSKLIRQMMKDSKNKGKVEYDENNRISVVIEANTMERNFIY